MTTAKTDIIKRLRAVGGESWNNPARIRNEAANEIEQLRAELDALRAKITEMEKQEPVAAQHRFRHPQKTMPDWSAWKECSVSHRPAWEIDSQGYEVEYRPLYALPGAQPAQKAVAYLDIGAGGYMDIGTDLTDEELATLPKGRHMLGVIGTYGVDGYVPSQPAPRLPDHKTIRDLLNESGLYAYNRKGDLAFMVAVTKFAALLAAQEAKP